MSAKRRPPFLLFLTPSGGTMIILYPWCANKGELVTKFIEQLGTPEYSGPLTDAPDRHVMLWDHQEMLIELKEGFEMMTTEALLDDLGMFDK